MGRANASMLSKKGSKKPAQARTPAGPASEACLRGSKFGNELSLASACLIDLCAQAIIAEIFGAAGRFGPETGHSAERAPWFRVGNHRLDGVRYVGSLFMGAAVRG